MKNKRLLKNILSGFMLGILILIMCIIMILSLSLCRNFNFAATYETVINLPLCQDILFLVAEELKNESNNQTEIVLKISNRVSQNINWSDTQYCKRCLTDCETISKRCGACGEKSDLVSALLNSIGIDTVSVVAHGEDHTSNDVLIDNQWVFLDATGDGGTLNFNMSKHDYEKVYNKSISSMFIYYPNKTETEVTEDYTDVGRIRVYVKDKEGSINNVIIIAKSHSLMEQYPSRFSEPIESTHCIINYSGYCDFVLGGNNYTFVGFKYLLPFGKTEVIKIIENKDMGSIELKLDYNPDNMVILLAIIIIVTIILLYIFVDYLITKIRIETLN
jgi:hypothetical protein